MKIRKAIFWGCTLADIIILLVSFIYILNTDKTSERIMLIVFIIILATALGALSTIYGPYLSGNKFRFGYVYKLIAKEKGEEIQVLTFRCLNDDQIVIVRMVQKNKLTNEPDITRIVGELDLEKCYVVVFSGKINLVSGNKMYLSEVQI